MGIRLGYNWCFEISRGIGGPDPYYTVRLRTPEQNRLLEVASLSSFGYALNNAVPQVRSTEQCARDYAIVAIMLYGGLFLDQVASLKTDAIMIDSGQHFISYTRENGALCHHPLLSPKASQAVDNYLSVTSRVPAADDALFLSADVETKGRTTVDAEFIGQILLSLMREVPLHSERASVFALRNSFAKTWIDAGREVRELQDILDLRTDRVMKRYVNDLENRFVNHEQEELVIGDWQTNLFGQLAMRCSEDPIGCLRSQGKNKPYLAVPCDTGDVFLCCALEDESEVALPLARELLMTGLRVRLNHYSLRRDETLDLAITEGFDRCSYGIVIISQAFIAKKLSPRELSGLFAGVRPGSILPVWHNVSRDEVEALNPIIGRIQAANTEDGLECVAFQINMRIRLSDARS